VSGLPALAAEDHVCPTCPLVYAEIDIATVPDRVREVGRELHRTFAAADPAAIRRRPQPDTWSPVEYLCHVRDVYVASTIRSYRIRTEDSPAVEPLFNDLRVVRFRYAQADPTAVLAELDLVVAGFGDEVDRVVDAERTLSRQPNETRTARWLVRQALHEGLHHLADIRAGLAAAA
jgi:hypothetical protein